MNSKAEILSKMSYETDALLHFALLVIHYVNVVTTPIKTSKNEL